jgi:hypothetical protein
VVGRGGDELGLCVVMGMAVSWIRRDTYTLYLHMLVVS